MHSTLCVRYGAPGGRCFQSAVPSAKVDAPGAGKRKLRVGKSGKTSAGAEAGPEAGISRGKGHGLHQRLGVLAQGCNVILVGLKGAMHHNGKTGIIEGFLEEKSRYVVKISGTGEKLALKPENLSIKPA